MSIDEAIEKSKELASTYRIAAKNAENIFISKLMQETKRKIYIKLAEEHEQLAEWLEELKELRATSFGYRKEDIELNRTAMYNKAIDDFAEKLIRYVDCGHLCSPTEVRWSDLSVVEMVKELAEQLKEQK